MVADIRAAAVNELAMAKRWLADAGLPTEDLQPEQLSAFLVAMGDGEPAGIIGLEEFGHIGLLRSLVVDPKYRGYGIGRQLVAALETSAREKGIGELWLLTIDADAFFAALGYTTCDRDAAPAAIRETQEFSNLCPGDAVLMRKALSEP